MTQLGAENSAVRVRVRGMHNSAVRVRGMHNPTLLCVPLDPTRVHGTAGRHRDHRAAASMVQAVGTLHHGRGQSTMTGRTGHHGWVDRTP